MCFKKRCTRCEKLKLLIDFHKNKATKDGLNFWCKVCIKEYHNRPEVKKQTNTRNKIYRRLPEVKKKVAASAKKHRAQPGYKESIKAYHKEYCKKPEVKERQKEYNKKYCARPEYKKRRAHFRRIKSHKNLEDSTETYRGKT